VGAALLILAVGMFWTGAVGSAKGGSFWKWALLGVLFPLGLLVAIITPSRQGVSGDVKRELKDG